MRSRVGQGVDTLAAQVEAVIKAAGVAAPLRFNDVSPQAQPLAKPVAFFPGAVKLHQEHALQRGAPLLCFHCLDPQAVGAVVIEMQRLFHHRTLHGDKRAGIIEQPAGCGRNRRSVGDPAGGHDRRQ